MCGIAGKIAFGSREVPASTELLWRMVSAIRHRGPDEFGAYRDAHAALLSARLSIVDLKTGQQPMTNEEGNLWAVFNGEIFNYIELRSELRSHGHTFRTASDTEVVVHAFEQWGPGCFERFNGQWSVAIWEATSRELVLCRDRVGIRPLYVRRDGPILWFASEVKAIFADPAVPRAIDPSGVDQTLTFWSPVAPRTVFLGFEELRPGTFRRYNFDGRETETVYWSPAFRSSADDGWKTTFPMTLNEAAAELESRLRAATSLRMVRADVPVGSYLSGGLDSSLIAAFGREASQGDFRTYSISFEDAEFDERPYQQLMAGALGGTHVEMVVKKSEIAEVFPEVVRHAERPLLRTAPAPLYLLSKAVHESGIKAVLTGEGADEMLAGYDLFREAKIREHWAREPRSRRRPMLLERLYPYLARSPQQTRAIATEFWRIGLDAADQPGFSHGPRWRTTSMLKRFFSREFNERVRLNAVDDLVGDLPKGFQSWNALGQAQYLELKTLFSGYIISSQGDRMLMAHSVEGRFPFLDDRVMEFCMMLPSDYKLRLLDEKHILKKLAKGKIPEPILRRPKQPYRAPDALSFLLEGAPGYVSDHFSEEALRRSGMFEPKRGRALYEKCRSTVQKKGGSALFSNADNMAFLGILSAQLLHATFVDGDPNPPPGPVNFNKFVGAADTTTYNRPGGTNVVT
jgi:asparagine synthase (glutamine-hydrolysing)